ncbi:MAG: T9SS type A sorting domain-containing protein [Candidatus Delongbacteria bacterium]|nr:T9SS type A sorting domain-containing protein [Candidatus Delongbacteria bacterium]
MKKLLTVVITCAVLTTAAVAGQVTFGDWDFIGVDCFPGSTVGWDFDVIAGTGIVIVDIIAWDWGQYDIIFEGSGAIRIELSNCEIADPGVGSYLLYFLYDGPIPEPPPDYPVLLDEEPYTDENSNGQWDSGEPFEDLIDNGIHDEGLLPLSFCGFCDQVTELVMTEFVLAPAYPNPFNPTTTIEYSLATSGSVQLSIYNIQGQLVDVIQEGFMTAGWHTAIWSPSDLSSGIYMVELSAGGYPASRKVMYLK